MEIFGPIIISTLAGLSTVIGGFIVCLKTNKTKGFIVFSLSFSLSVMIGVSVLELLPNSTITIADKYGFSFGLLLIVAVFFIGSITINILNNLIKKNFGNKTDNLYRVGVLSMLALMFHNFPEGIATFITSYKDLSLGIPLSIAIMMHNIPEGIGIAAPIYYSTNKKSEGIKYTFIAGLAEPLGAILAFLLLKNFINDILISFVLIFVSGIMISLSINKLYPEVLKYNKKLHTNSGLILGIILVLINHFLF